METNKTDDEKRAILPVGALVSGDELARNKTPKTSGWLNYNVIAVVAIVKILTLIFAAQSFQMITEQPIAEADWFWGIFSRWDADSYLKIAESGYASSGEGQFRLVFFPLYPALIALFQIVFRNYVLSAFVVSGVATFVLGLSFRDLVRLDHSERTAQLAVLFLFIFPTGFFLHLPYTESLFLALTVGCFAAARRRMWLLVGVTGALACLTRINGLILLPALAFEVWDEYRATRRVNRSWIFLLLVAAGFAGYLALNYYVSGDATKFLIYQRENFYKYPAAPWAGIRSVYENINNPQPNDSQMLGVQEMTFIVIGLIGTLFGIRHLRKSYTAWMALNWLLFVSTSFVLSVPRYTLVMFPLFILMARAARRNMRLTVLFVVWSMLYFSLFLAQFVRGWWAF